MIARFVAVFTLVAAMHDASSGEDGPSLDDIVAGIAASRAPVASLRAVVSRNVIIDNGESLSPATPFGEVEFAFDGSKRYLRVKRVHTGSAYVSNESGGLDVIPVEQAIQRGLLSTTIEEVRVLNEDRFYSSRGAVAELHTLATVRKTAGSNFDEYYLRCLGWYIHDLTAPDDFEANRKAMALPDVIAACSMKVAPGAEDVDGIRCVRLHGAANDGSTRTLWLAPSLGYMLMRRDAADSTGIPISQMVATEPVEITPGCWLPRRCTYSYEYTGAKPGHMDEMRLVDWQVGDVDDALFETRIPDDAAIVEHGKWDQPMVTFPPVGRNELDQSIAQSTISGWLLWVNLLVIAAIVIAALILKWMRVSRSSQKS